MKLSVWVIAAFLLLAVVGGYAIQSSASKQSDGLREYQLEDCISTLGGRDDVVERDGDLAFFAGVAAVARRKDGEEAVARKYDHIAAKAQARTVRAKERAALGLAPNVAFGLDYKDRCIKARPELKP